MCSSRRNVKVRAQMLQLHQPDGRQQLEQPIPEVLRVCYNLTGLLAAALDTEVLSDDRCPLVMRRTAVSDLCRDFPAEGGAAAILGRDGVHLHSSQFIPSADSSKTC